MKKKDNKKADLQEQRPKPEISIPIPSIYIEPTISFDKISYSLNLSDVEMKFVLRKYADCSKTMKEWESCLKNDKIL